MSDTPNSQTTPTETASPANQGTSDSLGIPMKKSPILIYALLQIPLLLIMVVILYFMYRAKNPS